MEQNFDSSFGIAMNSRVGQSSNSLICEREFTHPKRPTYVPKLWDEWDCENGPVFHAHPRNGSDKNEIENTAQISLGVLECPLDIETDGQREKPSFVPCLWSNWETQIENENSNNSLYQGTDNEHIANPTITPQSELPASLNHLIESLFLASSRSLSEDNYDGCPLSSDAFGEWIEEILDNPDNLLEVHLEARKVVEAIYESKDIAPETPKSATSDEFQGHDVLSDEFLLHNEFKISPCNDSVNSERIVSQVRSETEIVQPKEHDIRLCKTPSPRCSTPSFNPRSDRFERSASEGPDSERSTSPRSASARSTPRSSVRSTIESCSDAVKSTQSSEHISVYSDVTLTSNTVEKKDRLARHYAEIAKREALLGFERSTPERPISKEFTSEMSTPEKSISERSTPRSSARITIKSDSDDGKSAFNDKTADAASSECLSLRSVDTPTSNTDVNKDRLAGHCAEIAKREALLGIERSTSERSTSDRPTSARSTSRPSTRSTIKSDSDDPKSTLNDKTADVALSECTSLNSDDTLTSNTDVNNDRLAGHYAEVAKREELLERLRSGEIMATPIYINGQRWRLAEHYVEMNRRLKRDSQEVKSTQTDCNNTNAKESEAEDTRQQRLQQHYDAMTFKAMNRNTMNRDAMNRDTMNSDAMNLVAKMRHDGNSNRGSEQDRFDQTNMQPNMQSHITIRILEDKQTYKAVTFSEDTVEEPFIPLSPHSTLPVSSFKNSDSDFVLTSSVNGWANSALNHGQYRDNINADDAPRVGTGIDKKVLGSSNGQGDSCDFSHDLVTVSSNNDQSQSFNQIKSAAKSVLNHHLRRFLTCLPEVDLSKLNIPVAGPPKTENVKNMKQFENNMKISLNCISTEKLNRARRTLRRYKRMKKL